MELKPIDFHSNKTGVSMKNSCWHHAFILLGLLCTFTVAAYVTECIPGTFATQTVLWFQRISFLWSTCADNVTKTVHECFANLAIKFLNFCIAKSLQFRNIGLLQAQTSLMSMVFWVTLTRSTSALYS